MDWKNSYFLNDHYTQSHLHNAHQTKAFFTEIKENPKIFVELQKTLNSQSNTEKEQQKQSHDTSWLQTIL